MPVPRIVAAALACVLLVGRTALAAEPDVISSGLPPPFWVGAQHRATVTAGFGASVFLVGVGLTAAGLKLNSDAGVTVLDVGLVVDAVAIPPLAGGALRVRTALGHRGLYVPPGFGLASWALYGGSVGLFTLLVFSGFVEFMGGGGPGTFDQVTESLTYLCLAGSWTMGLAQLLHEDHLARSAPLAAAAGAGFRRTVVLAPRIGRRSLGLALAGTF